MAKSKRRRPQRIYYGPEGHEKDNSWTVNVVDAKKAVTIDGDVIHALRGYPGVTVGCGLSNMAIDKKNRSAFPHAVYLAAFTKSTVLIVDKLSSKRSRKGGGLPVHAVLYAHSYGHIADRNDDRTLKKLVREDPTIIQRPFTLRPPRKARPTGTDVGRDRSTERNAPRHTIVPRGALARAVKAGLIGKHVAEQMTEIAESN